MRYSATAVNNSTYVWRHTLSILEFEFYKSDKRVVASFFRYKTEMHY
jgi:hypothetical protein